MEGAIAGAVAAQQVIASSQGGSGEISLAQGAVLILTMLLMTAGVVGTVMLPEWLEKRRRRAAARALKGDI